MFHAAPTEVAQDLGTSGQAVQYKCRADSRYRHHRQESTPAGTTWGEQKEARGREPVQAAGGGRRFKQGWKKQGCR